MNGSVIVLNITMEDLKLALISHENGHKVIKKLHLYRPEKEAYLDIKEVIGNFLQEENEKTPKAILVINSRDLHYREFSLPFDSSKKVMKAIGFEIATDYPSSEFLFDHIKSVGREPGKNTFWAAIVHREMLTKRIKELEEANLQIIGITCDMSTLGHYFLNENEALVMEMGERQTLFALFIRGIPVLVRDVAIGLKGLMQDLTKDRKIIKSLSSEIKRTVHSFYEKTGLPLKKIFVTGNILVHQEILNALEENLDIEFGMLDPENSGFNVQGQVNDVNMYASVLGAAFWKKRNGFFNFLKDEFIQADPKAVVRKSFFRVTILVFCLLAAFFLSSWFKVLALEKRKGFLEGQIRETFAGSFPHVKRVVDEVRQANNILEAKRRELGGSNLSLRTSILDALEIISRSIPAEINFQISSLFWEIGKLEINGETDSFKNVNAIQGLLAKNPNLSEVTISNAKTKNDGKNVEFKITVRLKG